MPILDNILESDRDSSELDNSDKAEDSNTSEEDESLIQLNSDEFRLDRENKRESTSARNLFVEDESMIASPLKSDLSQRSGRRFSQGGSTTVSPTRVQFKDDQVRGFEERALIEKTEDPWDLKSLIRKTFTEKLPDNYDFKGWKYPSKRLVSNIVNILENNADLAIESTFQKYKSECAGLFQPRDVKNVRKSKARMLYNTIGKIEHRIRKSRFPSRTLDRDYDIEYIYAKRKFIQERYSQESQHVESIEHQLVREQKALEDLKSSHAKLAERVTNQTKLLTEQLSKNLHPALSKAMVNSFGLLKDNDANKECFNRDVDDLNLQLVNPVDDCSDPSIQKYLPSLQKYEQSVQGLRDEVNKFMDSAKDNETQ